MRIEDAAQQFLQYLQHERGCTDATAEAYASDVRRCVAYLKGAGIEPETAQVDLTVVREYVRWLVSEGYSAGTVSRRVAGLSSMWKWLLSEGHEIVNPWASVILPKRRRRMPAVLTVQEAGRLLAASAVDRDVKAGFRNRAAIATLLFCGLRRSELLGLRVSDVDLRSRWLRVRRGKGGRGRSVPMTAEAAEAVGDWLELRPAVGHD